MVNLQVDMGYSDVANHADIHSPNALRNEYFDRTFTTDEGVLISHPSNIEETEVVRVKLSRINLSDEKMTKDLVTYTGVDLTPTNLCDEQMVEDLGGDVVKQQFIGDPRSASYSFVGGSTLAVGQEFETKEEVKNELIKIAISACFEIHVLKSTKILYEVRCVTNACTWRVRAGKMNDSTRFRIKTYCNTHTCDLGDRRRRHRQASSAVVALLENYKGKYTTPTPKLIMTMMQNKGLGVSYYKEWKGKQISQNKLRGDPDENCMWLPSYLEMIKRVNDEQHRFKYVFVVFGACVSGFKFMRKVIAIDGTFLKGKYKGVLLVATAQYGDFYQYPIAWGVVDSETTESWTWFLKNLQELIPDDERLLIISDRHQGIINVVANVYENAHHGYCVWHLSQNIKSKFRKTGASESFARIAHLYKSSEFDSQYADMKSRYPQLAAYLEEHTCFEKWCRSYYPSSRYNIMTTNGVESINSRLWYDRELPIISLLDALQKVTSGWFTRYRNAANECTTSVTPSVEKILRERFILSQTMHVEELNEMEYDVTGHGHNEIVDFGSK
ncbi:uncharacterized protein [Henckelia pumila]|uniref:uncharacterized protein n=1 Tax=Henckelia pumila TaxID=405737 RepID=UPI003C6E0FCA